MISKRLFNTIASGKTDEMYSAVTNAALYIATGGFLGEANQILEMLWRQGLPHDRKTWVPDLSFQVLWETSGEYPKNIPFPLENLDIIEVNYRKYIGGDHYAYEMPKMDWQEYKGKNAYRVAQTWFLDKKKDTDTAFLLQKALDYSQELVHHELATATVMAAEIAASNGDEIHATKIAVAWVENYHAYSSNVNFPLMAQSRHVAPLILRGVLSKPLKLSKKTCANLVNDIIKAVEKRMALGRSLVYGDLSWKDLLKKASKLAIKDAPEYFSDIEKKAQWLGRVKATSKTIKDAEKRLNIELPEDYKAFLLTSNGFLNFLPNVFCELLPIEKIDLYKKLEDKELYDITITYIDGELYETDKKATLKPYLEKAILVGKSHGSEMVFLIPKNASQNDWEAWFFASWVPGEERYPSFRHLIEDKIQVLDEINS
jgi:hypothetical protein